MMHADPQSWHRLAGWLAKVSRAFLDAQVEGGAQAVQLFDSWAGSLSTATFREFIAPHSTAALEGIEVPRIHFGVGTGAFLDEMRLGGLADAVGVDWRMPLDEAAAASAPTRPCRATSTRRCWAPRGRCCAPTSTTCWPRSSGARARAQPRPRRAPDTDPDQLTRIVAHAHGEGE